MALKIFLSNALQRSVFRFNQKLSSCIYLKVIKYSIVHSLRKCGIVAKYGSFEVKVA